MDAYTMQVGELALYGGDDGPAKYHHNQECGTLRSVAAQPGNGKHEYGRPHNGAKQTAAKECVGSYHACGKDTNKHAGHTKQRKDEQSFCGLVLAEKKSANLYQHAYYIPV